jgi:CRP/FNR family transcriptional regulator
LRHVLVPGALFRRLYDEEAAFLLAQGESDGVVPMSQARIAAHLGAAREVVFRSVRSLAARGLVATRRGEVRLLDRPALARLVGSEATPDQGRASKESWAT